MRGQFSRETMLLLTLKGKVLYTFFIEKLRYLWSRSGWMRNRNKLLRFLKTAKLEKVVEEG
jgi:hypothetical protein